MSSPLAAPSASPPSVIVGCQTPRIISTPRYRAIATGRWSGLEDAEALAYRSPAGQEACEFAADAGVVLDPWQQLSLHHSLAEDAEGRWECFEVVLNVARQNGKGGYLEIRQLAGVLLFGDQLVIHTAHEFKTAQESFRRLDHIIEGSYAISRRIRRVSRANGEEGFEFHSGARIRFLARSGGSGRGFSGDLVVMDEAMKLRADPIGALLPVMSARRNPQLVYGASAGLGEDSEQLGALRARALADTPDPDPSLAYLEWSVDPHLPECRRDELTGAVTCENHDNRGDERSWARANPALGIRIRPAHIAREMATMRADLFDRERLGVGDYPSVEAEAWTVISEDAWRHLADATSQLEGTIAFCADVTPERSAASIAAAGRRQDGRWHVEVIEHRPGTGWVVGRLTELVERWQPCAVVVDGAGPAGSLIAPLETAGIEVVKPTGRDAAQAAGQFYDAVGEDQLRHLDQAPLNAALAGAQQRKLGDAWAWARRATSVDISPLVACTLAAWGHETNAHRTDEEPDPMFWNWADL